MPPRKLLGIAGSVMVFLVASFLHAPARASAATAANIWPNCIAGQPCVIQSLMTSLTGDESLNGIQLHLPQPTLGGNMLILSVYRDANVSISSIVNDGGGTWIQGPSTKGPDEMLDTWYLPNAPANIDKITVNYSAPLSTQYTSLFNVVEVAGIATTSPLDGTPTASNASTNTITPGAITTTQDGDFIYNSVAANYAWAFYDTDVQYTPASGAVLLGASPYGKAAEQFIYQPTHGSINPTMGIATSPRPWFSAAMAFKSSPGAGTLPGPGIRIVRLQHYNDGNSTSPVIQFPTSGNLTILATTDVPPSDYPVSKIADTAKDTWTEAPRPDATNDSQVWYAQNVTPSQANTLSWTQGVTYTYYTMWDIAGATASPFDTDVHASGEQTAAGATINDSPDITPNTAHGLVIDFLQYGTGPASGATGTPGLIFDSVWANGMTDQDHYDTGDSNLHYFNATTGTIKFGTTMANAQQTFWDGLAVAFKGTAVNSSGTVPTVNGFTAVPSSFTLGSSTSMSWNVSNASSVVISGNNLALSTTTLVGTVPVTPNATGTLAYSLSATNPFGTASSSLSVTVTAPTSTGTAPVINVFTSSPSSITLGSMTNLSWNTTGASLVTLTGDGLNFSTSTASDTVSVIPDATGTIVFMLAATNPYGTSTATTAVTVTAPTSTGTAPTVNSFAASPASITLGSSSLLSWDTANASSVTISGDNLNFSTSLATGTVPVTPDATGTLTYILSAANPNGTSSVTTNITVSAPTSTGSAPTVTSFTIAPSSITLGSSTVLSWKVANASSVVLSGNNLNLTTSTASGTVSVTPNATGTLTYMLTATNPNGQAGSNATVTVTAQTGGGGTITLLATASASSLTLPAVNVASGNTIIVFVKDEGGNPTAVHDSQGNTYVNIGCKDTTTVLFTCMYYATNIHGSTSLVVSSTNARTSFGRTMLWGYSGLNAVNPLDVSSTQTGTKAATLTSPSFRTTSNDVIITGYASEGGSLKTIKAATTFAQTPTSWGPIGSDTGSGYMSGVPAGTGTTSITWTGTAPSQEILFTAAFHG